MGPAPGIRCMYPSGQNPVQVVVEFSEVFFTYLDPVWAPSDHKSVLVSHNGSIQHFGTNILTPCGGHHSGNRHLD